MATTNNWFFRTDADSPTWATSLVEELSVTANSVTFSYDIVTSSDVYSNSPLFTYAVESSVGGITGSAEFPFQAAESILSGSYEILQDTSILTVESTISFHYEIYSDQIIYVTVGVVPNIVGLPIEDATQALIAAGFVVGTTSQINLQ